MCIIRGIRHACGCNSYRFLSTCRATYADPKSPSTPRCLPSASFLINMTEGCMRCQYEEFCSSWKDKIAQATRKREDASARLMERFPERQHWNSWKNSWGGWNTWAEDDSFAYDDDASEYWGESGHTIDGPSECHDAHEVEDDDTMFDEKAQLMKERDEAEEEAEKLQTEFDKESWQLWQGFLHGTDVNSLGRRANYWNFRSKTSPKLNGGSRLRYVQNAADLPDFPATASNSSTYVVAEQSDTESDSDESSTSPSLSNCSTLSEGPYSFEPSGESSASEERAVRKDCFDQSWSAKEDGARVYVNEILMEDSDGDMLPMWLESFSR